MLRAIREHEGLKVAVKTTRQHPAQHHGLHGSASHTLQTLPDAPVMQTLEATRPYTTFNT